MFSTSVLQRLNPPERLRPRTQFDRQTRHSFWLEEGLPYECLGPGDDDVWEVCRFVDAAVLLPEGI